MSGYRNEQESLLLRLRELEAENHALQQQNARLRGEQLAPAENEAKPHWFFGVPMAFRFERELPCGFDDATMEALAALLQGRGAALSQVGRTLTARMPYGALSLSPGAKGQARLVASGAHHGGLLSFSAFSLSLLGMVFVSGFIALLLEFASRNGVGEAFTAGLGVVLAVAGLIGLLAAFRTLFRRSILRGEREALASFEAATAILEERTPLGLAAEQRPLRVAQEALPSEEMSEEAAEIEQLSPTPGKAKAHR